MGIFSKFLHSGKKLSFDSIGTIQPLTGEEEELKESLKNEIEMFEALKDEIKSVIDVSGDSILKSPIDKIEKTLYDSLMPKFQPLFISFMTYAKLYKARSSTSLKKETMFVLDVLVYILELDNGIDCFELLLAMKKAESWPSDSPTSENMVSIFFQRTKLGLILDDGIIAESGDMAQNIRRLKMNKRSKEQLDAFIEVFRKTV